MLAPDPEYPLSRGAAGGAGFFPAGRLDGGAGGTGLPLVAVPLTPLTTGAEGTGTGLDATGGGGGAIGWASTTSSTYADGTHPDAELSFRRASHQPRNGLVLAYIVMQAGLTIALFLFNYDNVVFLDTHLSTCLALEVVHRTVCWLFRSGRLRWWRRRRQPIRGCGGIPSWGEAIEIGCCFRLGYSLPYAVRMRRRWSRLSRT